MFFKRGHGLGEVSLHCPGSSVCVSQHAPSQAMCPLQAVLVELLLFGAQDVEMALLVLQCRF